MTRVFWSVLGIAAVLAVVFFFIRPDWMRQIASTPTSPAPTVATRVSARVSADRLMQPELQREKGGFLQIERVAGIDHTHRIVEEVGEEVPTRSNPYLMVINKANNTLRQCRLGSCVKKINLKLNYPGVKFQEIPTTPGGPYQAIIWVPHAMDLQIDMEVMLAPPGK